VRILRYGIDSLYLSFKGSLLAEASARLSAAKLRAQAQDDSAQALAQIELAGHLFEVRAVGRKRYPFILRDNAYDLQIASAMASKLPVAFCQIRSHWLTSQGVATAVCKLSEILALLCQIEGVPAVSRADLFCDFTCPLTMEEIEALPLVGRSRDISRYESDGIFTGFTVGMGGEMAARLYNKLLQILKSGQQYLMPLWHQGGWEPGLPVYRLEFEFKSGALRELGVRSLPDLMTQAGNLWGYGTQSWLRICEANPQDAKRSRWPTHPFWEALSALPWAGHGIAERVAAKPESAPPDNILIRRFCSSLSSVMGARGLTSVYDAFDRILMEARSYYDREAFMGGRDFEQFMLDRAANKAKRYNLPFPGFTQRAQDELAQAAAGFYRDETRR
jgi:hypothetical protein